MTKLLLLIATKKGLDVLETVNKLFKNKIGIVSSFKENNVMRSYTDEIEQYCEKNSIKFIKWHDLKSKILKIVEEEEITEVVTVSWKYLLDTNILEKLRHGVFVFHDSLLPKYRGFSPTPTAIMAGDKEIGITVIKADSGIDTGDIVIQYKSTVPDDLYIKDIIDSQAKLCSKAFCNLIDLLDSDKLKLTIQDNSKASYSIWRNPEDSEIDWSKSSEEIYNQIRATGFPYLGSYTYYKSIKITIDESEKIEDLNFVDRHYGKIWCFDKFGNPIIICGKGMLKIKKVHSENEKKFIFSNLRVKLGIKK